MPARVAAVRPLWAIESGRITIEGSGFPIDQPQLPKVYLGEAPARVVYASSTRIAALVPPGLEGGRTPVRIDGIASSDDARGAAGVSGGGQAQGIPGIDIGAVVEIAPPFATGLHQVDNPVFDRAGNLYVTYSGTRGQQVPVSIFRVRPDGTRETFCTGLVNPTSMAIGPEGDDLYVSSRFEGTVYRVRADGSIAPFATDLGVPCGLAFDREGTLFVGDRSGTIFRVDRAGQATTHALVPSSVAAFHLAFGPDQALYVTAPTLSPYDSVFKIGRDGAVAIRYTGFGRPQGIAFDQGGDLFVVEALAGVSGLYRLRPGNDVNDVPELMLTGPSLVGVAFNSNGGVVVCSNDTAYRLPRSG